MASWALCVWTMRVYKSKEQEYMRENNGFCRWFYALPSLCSPLFGALLQSICAGCVYTAFLISSRVHQCNEDCFCCLVLLIIVLFSSFIRQFDAAIYSWSMSSLPKKKKNKIINVRVWVRVRGVICVLN